MSDELTTLLPSMGRLPPWWIRAEDTPVSAPEADVMRRVLAGSRIWGTALCAGCGVEPVARPDLPRDLVEGRFCGGCIARCLDDSDRAHWCPVDALGKAGG